VAWVCIRSDSFDKAFEGLGAKQQALAKKIYNDIFRHNPFDSRLKTHKIHKLSSRYKKNVFSATLEGNFKVTFYKSDSQTVVAVDIGTHDIYK
jgi:hypothetical protein